MPNPLGWANMASIPASNPVSNMAGAAGAAGGIGGITAWLGANPLTAFMLGLSGVQALQKFLSGPTPYEQITQQQLGAYQQMIPQLQAQAAGQPTAATQNQFRQLRQATTQAQQSYAGAAQGRNMGQTTPTMANQQRFRQAEVGAMGNIMGQSQIAAQGMLSGMGQQAVAGQQQLEMQNQQAYGGFLNSVAGIMAEQKRAKSAGQYTAQLDQMNQTWMNLINALIGGMNKPAPITLPRALPQGETLNTFGGWVG